MLDLWIDSATVVDGTGAARYEASVGVEAGSIATIVREEAAMQAAAAIDGHGLVLAPGAVDVHNHSDVAPLVDPEMASMVRQGVTTVVVGNCGMSPFPVAAARELASWSVGGTADAPDLAFGSFGAFLDRIDEARPAVDVAALIGHGSVRRLAMGLRRGAPDAGELATMRHLVAEAMDAGAVGLSSGLIYAPGMYAGTDEIVALAEEAGRTGGLYASHVRGEGAHLFRAVDEAIAIGRRAGLPAHVSHLKCESSHVWGRASELLERIHGADDVTGDQYPYAAWASVLASLLPEWAPVADLRGILAEPREKARLVAAVEHGEGDEFQSSVDGVGWERIVIEATADASCAGRDVAEIARDRGVTPVDACLQLLLEDPDTSCIGHAMRDDDVRTIVADPEIAVASDSASTSPDGAMRDVPVHPRTYGTFPRVLGPAVRDGVLSLEAAVRKMTSLPADRFGLTRRGRVVVGNRADLVLFDPVTIADRATYDRPHAFPQGIEAVVVGGVVAWHRGGDTITRAGRTVRRAAS